MMKNRIYGTVLFAAALTCTPTHAAGPHEHGAARLHVAIDGDRLQLAFTSPLDTLVGFERAPRNAKETAAVKSMAERLGEPERLFVPTPEARCTRASVDLESPVIDPALLGSGAQRARAPAKSHGGHASIDAEIAFRCDNVRALTAIDVKAFEAFPRMKRLDVQVAGAKKQTGAKLTPRNPRLAL